MLARIRKSMDEKDQGFTLIELLVVMIIIGILAAIAIPVFLSQRKKAEDSATKSDVSTVGKEVATYYVDNSGAPTLSIQGTAPNQTYGLVPSGAAAGTTPTSLGKVSKNVGSLTQNFTSATSWCIALTNTQGSTQTWKYSAAGGLQSGACVAADYA